METQDKIGREIIVNKISGLVTSLKEGKHFCLALNGAWGSGKSFVLDLLEEKFADNKEFIIIRYDAWENSFYSEPLIAILSCLIDGLDNKFLKIGKYAKKKISDKIRRIFRFLTRKHNDDDLIVKAIKELLNIILQIKKISLLEDTQDGKISDFKSYQTLLSEAINVLNKVTDKKRITGKQTKLIILVDEIDRCLPDAQLKILERLHHFLKVKNCATIVAMNQTSVAKTVQSLYGIDGYEYLRKFFDFTFKLEASADIYLNNLFEGFIDRMTKLNLPKDKVSIPVNLAYQCLLYSDSNILTKVDNRELTRYYDAVISICNDFGWQNLKPCSTFFILVALFIRKHISSSFLNQNEIIEKQKEQNKIIKSLSWQEQSNAMHYFDYIKYYLGLDRMNPPEAVNRLYYGNICAFTDHSRIFNEIIYYSLDKEFYNNEQRIGYNNQPAIAPETCAELVRLIILYGGEQEQCEK